MVLYFLKILVLRRKVVPPSTGFKKLAAEGGQFSETILTGW